MRTRKLLLAAVCFAVSVMIGFDLMVESGLSQTRKPSGWEEDTIESVSDDGSILKMESGHVFEVDEADQVDSQLWQPSDDVLFKCTPIKLKDGKLFEACKIIDLDEENEKVDAEMLK